LLFKFLDNPKPVSMQAGLFSSSLTRASLILQFLAIIHGETFLEKPTIGLLRHALYFPTFLASPRYADPPIFLWFQAFSLKVECSVSTAGLGHPTVKPPLAILNGTSNPIGLHNEHSLFQRISIHLHYDVNASKHPASLLTTN
jgi:hypothetical protein